MMDNITTFAHLIKQAKLLIDPKNMIMDERSIEYVRAICELIADSFHYKFLLSTLSVDTNMFDEMTHTETSAIVAMNIGISRDDIYKIWGENLSYIPENC